jgi:hypothetical protein
VTRLTSEFWVAAYRKHLDMLEIPCFVLQRGHASAGAVFVKVNTLDGAACVYQRSFDLMTGERSWIELTRGPEPECDVALSRQRGFDPDIWILEVEDRAGRHLLDEPHLNG